MSFARCYSAQATLLSAELITIEVDITGGSLNAFSIVGLPDKAVEESRDRIASAIKNADQNFTSPKASNQKTVISLAPAGLKKEGAVFELGMALAYLLADGDIEFTPDDKLFLGELALDGTLRPVRGALPLVRQARHAGFREVYVPHENAREAAIIDGITVYPASTLRDVVTHLDASYNPDGVPALCTQPTTPINEAGEPENSGIDFADIRGQENAKRGLEIAAAGGHNIALYGPPGTGKTMLARALRGALPPLSPEDALDVTSIHSVAGTLSETLVTHPPFRAPHHTSSYVSIVGGGTVPKPGEITLAHKGVLFMDEFPEFDRRVIETLRQPLEERIVSVSRAGGSAEFPADVILIAAMNPCPCGNFGSRKECRCSAAAVERYRRKISGPIMDRVDLWIEVPPIEHSELLSNDTSGKSSAEIRRNVLEARKKQGERAREAGLTQARNSQLPSRNIAANTRLTAAGREALDAAATGLDLSARSYHRTLKLARTIADLDGDEQVGEGHVAEALQYRPKDNA